MKLGHDWWTDPNYSHGLLIPFVIGYILWTNREQLTQEQSQPSLFWGGTAVLLALFALWAGTAGSELYTQRLSLVLMLAGIVVYFWGFRHLQRALVPLVLLALAIPVPAIVLNKIAFPLQIFASKCAVWSMRLFSINVLRQGNVIELLPRGSLDTKKLEVVEACSGIRSLMTLITLSLVFAYVTFPGEGEPKTGGQISRWLKSFGVWRSAILILAAVPIAILTNALRVSGTGVLAHYYGTGVADGFFHSFSGWVIYISAALLMFAVAWLVDWFDPRRTRLASKKKKPNETVAGNAKATAATAIPVEEVK
jgi:exosortase